MDKDEKVRVMLYDLLDQGIDWPICADEFISWNMDKSFKTKSFETFVEQLDEKYLEDGADWDFFFGYSDDYERFAEDWVVPEEQVDYLLYCKGNALIQALEDKADQIKAKLIKEPDLINVFELGKYVEDLTTNEKLREYLVQELFDILCGDKDLAYDGYRYIYPVSADIYDLLDKKGLLDDEDYYDDLLDDLYYDD